MEQINNIADQLNELIDLNGLNEDQEKLIFTFILFLIIYAIKIFFS
jgi:hypothetical protein